MVCAWGVGGIWMPINMGAWAIDLHLSCASFLCIFTYRLELWLSTCSLRREQANKCVQQVCETSVCNKCVQQVRATSVCTRHGLTNK